jgi:Sigma-70 region 2
MGPRIQVCREWACASRNACGSTRRPVGHLGRCGGWNRGLAPRVPGRERRPGSFARDRNEPTTLEEVARRAVLGDRDALDSLVRELQGDIYGLALRMLWNREDAEDATQEILERVVTMLAQFDFRSKLRTWVYRLAVNCLDGGRQSPESTSRLTGSAGQTSAARSVATSGGACADLGWSEEARSL